MFLTLITSLSVKIDALWPYDESPFPTPRSEKPVKITIMSQTITTHYAYSEESFLTFLINKQISSPLRYPQHRNFFVLHRWRSSNHQIFAFSNYIRRPTRHNQS